jgi:hypothetical protein
MGYNARNDEIRDNLTRMQREWEAERLTRPANGALPWPWIDPDKGSDSSRSSLHGDGIVQAAPSIEFNGNQHDRQRRTEHVDPATTADRLDRDQQR